MSDYRRGTNARERVVGEAGRVRSDDDRRLAARRDQGRGRYDRYGGSERRDKSPGREGQYRDQNSYQGYQRSQSNYQSHGLGQGRDQGQGQRYNGYRDNQYSRYDRRGYDQYKGQRGRDSYGYGNGGSYGGGYGGGSGGGYGNGGSNGAYGNGHSSSYRPGREPRERPRRADPDAGVPKEELIRRYEAKLRSLEKAPALHDLKLLESKWGVKPKGFESVTAQRAKMSGLFPLPGATRPVDVTKLADGKDAAVLLDKSKIDPIDSRNASVLIVENIDFEKYDYLKITDFFNRFLGRVDVPQLLRSANIESKRKTKDDKKLIIEFKNNTGATIVYALDGRHLDYSTMKLVDAPTADTITLAIKRPGEYVCQCLPPYKQITDDIDDDVKDSPRKLTVSVAPDLTETQILEKLQAIAHVKGFQLLREVGTKESLGLAFAEFWVDPSLRTAKALETTDQYVTAAQEVFHVRYACAPKGTSIQDCPIEFGTLRLLVKNEYVTTHPRSRVIQLINLVTGHDLVDDKQFAFIQDDILQEVEQFGRVVSIKIPRPASNHTPGISQFTQPGLGKVYVEFQEEDAALKAIMGLAGRTYNDRTVLCAFYHHGDYVNGLL